MTASKSETSEGLATHQIVFYLLCATILMVGTVMGDNSAQNAVLITCAEITFIFLYLAVLRGPIKLLKTYRLTSPISIILFAWLISLTISLFISPYDLLHDSSALYRYVETLAVIAFYFVVKDLFNHYQFPLHWVLITISISCLAVAFGFMVLLLNLDPLERSLQSERFWLSPFNAHIRHNGYQAAAAVSLLAPFFIYPARNAPKRIALLLLFVGLCTFIFWMGGRGSVLGVYAAFLCLIAVLRLKRVKIRRVLFAITLSTLAGLILSELLAVYDWNGILDLLWRTASSSDLNQLTTGRSRIWLACWESVREHLLFGLGPQGYFLMPNRPMAAQPHSMLVQFVVEWGLIGALLFSILLWYGFLRGLAVYVVEATGKVNVVALSAATMIAALTIHGLTDGTYYHGQPMFYLAICFAIWTLPPQQKPPEKSASPAS